MIKIPNDSIKLLENCLEAHAPELITLLNDTTINYTPEIYNKFRSAIGDELALKGFNETWEPNEYGLKLEALIDEIGRLFL